MILRNKVKAIIAVLILAVSLTACTTAEKPAATKTEPPKTEAPAAKKEPVKVELKGVGAAGVKLEKELTLEKMLVYAVQDEYVAEQQYKTILADLGNNDLFKKITNEETMHASAALPLLKKYNVAEVAADYKAIVAHPKSWKEAAAAGVQAEINNIEMFETFLKQPNLPEDVKTIFKELRDASKVHQTQFEEAGKSL